MGKLPKTLPGLFLKALAMAGLALVRSGAAEKLLRSAVRRMGTTTPGNPQGRKPRVGGTFSQEVKAWWRSRRQAP